MMFYSLKDGTLSSFSKINAEKMSRIHNSPITPIRIEVWPLKEVFEKHLDGRMIDFMSVDVEGFDLCVLKSNDWNQFRPTLLIVEMNNEYEEIVDFLRNNNYLLIFNNLYNGIFIDLRTRENHLRKIIET
jgi:hypothetical protein